jgi:3-deoxy-D-manno-octulosonic acid kinase
MTYTGDLLTERIDGARSLAQRVVGDGLPISDWIAVGRCIRRFHDFGLCHADLNAHNVLFDGLGAVHLIDFDRGRLRPRGLWCDSNLVRLRRSLLKVTDPLPGSHFSETDWQSLLAGYVDEAKRGSGPAP